MKSIELTMECHSEGNAELQELGIDAGQTEWRPCVIPLDAIMAVYPHRESGSLVIIGGEDYHMRESYQHVADFILNA